MTAVYELVIYNFVLLCAGIASVLLLSNKTVEVIYIKRIDKSIDLQSLVKAPIEI